MRTIRTITGTHGHATVEEHLENGQHVYTVRMVWPSTPYVLEVPCGAGQGRAQRAARRLVETPSLAAVPSPSELLDEPPVPGLPRVMTIDRISRPDAVPQSITQISAGSF